MSYYEYMVITRQNFLQDNRPDDLLKKVSSMLGEQGKIIRHEYWGLRNFQYVIKRKRRGHYVLLYIDAETEIIKDIQKKMSIDDNILRYLAVKIEAIPTFVSPLVQNYEDIVAEPVAENGSNSNDLDSVDSDENKNKSE